MASLGFDPQEYLEVSPRAKEGIESIKTTLTSMSDFVADFAEDADTNNISDSVEAFKEVLEKTKKLFDEVLDICEQLTKQCDAVCDATGER